MNSNLEKTLTSHLISNPAHAIRVFCDGEKKVKEGKKERYAFTYNDILTEYGSISSFLHQLNVFSKVEFELVAVYKYGNKTSYRTKNILTQKNNKMSKYPANSMHPENGFLGYPTQMMETMLGAARGEDYLQRAKKAENELADFRSENRILREEVASLKMDLKTSKRESELDFKEKEMNRKGFFETDTGGTVIELLGEMAPKCLDLLKAKTPVAVNALGLPSNLSESKRNLIQRIGTSTENQVLTLDFILNNWTPAFVEKLEEITKQ